MQARLIAYVPEGPAIARIVAPGERLRIGRAEDADLCLAHGSVSRRHAELRPGPDGAWTLVDLESKNGSFVDGVPAAGAPLPANCWLRLGDVHCEFSALDPQAAEAQARRWRERRTQATALTARIDALAHPDGITPGRSPALLEHSLRAVLELAQCSRGFVLMVEDGRYAVAAALSLDAAQPVRDGFSGSHGAVARALNTRQPVVLNDIGQEAWLARRDSVIQGRLRTLVALPLFDEDRPLGVIYADRREPGPPLTTLDLELLQAFAERCALWIAAQRGEAGAAGVPPPSEDEWPALFTGSGVTR